MIKVNIDYTRGTLLRSDGTEVFCPFSNGPCRINCFCIAFENHFDNKSGYFHLKAVCYRTANSSIALDLDELEEDQP